MYIMKVLCVPPKTKTTVNVVGSFLGYTVFTKEKYLHCHGSQKSYQTCQICTGLYKQPMIFEYG